MPLSTTMPNRSLSHHISSRRAFLSTSAVAAAHVWIPRPVKGYSAEEVAAQMSGSNGAIGISKWELDTPALCVDLDRMEQNIARMQAAAKQFGIATRPHAKTHKSADIAKKQLAAGAIGICTAKLGEAEALIAHGIERICMTTCNVSPAKIRRAMQLRKTSPHFIQAVDEEQNARALSAAAREAGVVADVMIDVAVGTRSGIPAESALALAKMVDRLPNLKLRGLLSYDGGAQHIAGFDARKQRTLENIAANARVFEDMKKAGLSTEIFSGGGTGTYNIQHLVPGFTDIQVGSYVFMDMQYLAIGGEKNQAVYDDFASSLTVVATVLNNRFPGRLTTDAGAKALTLNMPRAGVIGEPTADYNAGSDEFGVITFKGEPSRSYKIGDRLELIVPHCDPVVNLYDVMYGIRNDRVAQVLPVTARGRSQ